MLAKSFEQCPRCGHSEVIDYNSNLKPNGHCEFSPCRKWRYTLWRNWSDDPIHENDDMFRGQPKKKYGTKSDYLQVIGLNPSTADETINDPTVARCIDFAKRWGFGGLCMTNLFAFRATDPNVMKEHSSPIGDRNDRWLDETSQNAGLILFAWGNHGTHLDRAATVSAVLCAKYRLKTVALEMTKAMQPKHPLYIKADTEPFSYPPTL